MRAILGTMLIAASALAQSFDAASIRQAEPPTPGPGGLVGIRGPSGGPGSKDPGRINFPYMTLKSMLMIAYDVKYYQISGPAWLETERFDVNATMPPETTKDQYRAMLRNLLIDRFKMAVHKESRELPMYSLVLGKGGPMMKESVITPPDPNAPPPPAFKGEKIGADGFPVLQRSDSSRPGMPFMMMPGRARLYGFQQTMQDLANRLTDQLNRPVTDNTGLTAKYDFVLTYAPGPDEGLMGGGRGPGPGVMASAGAVLTDGEAPQPLFGALQSQLGLKLEPKKGDVEIVVIDKMEKTPTEN